MGTFYANEKNERQSCTNKLLVTETLVEGQYFQQYQIFIKYNDELKCVLYFCVFNYLFILSILYLPKTFTFLAHSQVQKAHQLIAKHLLLFSWKVPSALQLPLFLQKIIPLRKNIWDQSACWRLLLSCYTLSVAKSITLLTHCGCKKNHPFIARYLHSRCCISTEKYLLHLTWQVYCSSCGLVKISPIDACDLYKSEILLLQTFVVITWHQICSRFRKQIKYESAPRFLPTEKVRQYYSRISKFLQPGYL